MNSQDSRKRDWNTIKQTAQKRDAFSESALRNLIHRADKNGLQKHITRKGRRVYIDLIGLDEWMEESE